MSLKILLVEDNETNIKLMLRYLELIPCELEIARTGEEAISKADEFTPTVILMDLGLPDIDGWEASKKIREIKKLNDVFIFIVSAHVGTEDREKASLLGSNDFLDKPIDFQLLKSKLEKFL